MYWLYFARDFYRAGKQDAAPQKSETPRSQIVCVAVRNPAAAPSTPPLRKRTAKAKKQQDFVIKSAPLEEPPLRSTASPLQDYMQRLSVEGEHAFGVWDEEEGFTSFSENFERVSGFSAEECLGHDWIHLIHHTEQYAVNEALLNALEGHEGKCMVQAQQLREGDETRWLMMDIKPHGREVMVMFRDLTEQKALEAALKQTEGALAMAERSRAAFLSSMSHELRTPLNAIMGFSEIMKSAMFGELGNKTYLEYAKHIHDSGSALLTKINDLLDIASMDAGGLELEETQFYLAEMLNDAIEMHTHHAFERKQKITLDCPYPIELVGDRAKLLCSVMHLISNAVRHSAEGGEITVSVRVQQGEGIILSVRDHGEGIAQPQLEVIRGALAAEVAYFNIESGGIGLGLSLSKELLQRHGGRVMIDSVRHRGTVASLMLPIARGVRGLPQARRRAGAPNA